MSIDETLDQAQALPETLLEEAAIWHARLRDPEAINAPPAGFVRWLAADPRHAGAYAEMERLWATLEAPVKSVLAEETLITGSFRTERRALPAWQRAAVAACLLMVALGAGVAWQAGLVDDLRSDYVTTTGAQRTVTLADGSEVMLNTDSALAVAFAPGRRVVRLFRGEAWFSVAQDAGRPFVVDTPEGNIRVTGTKFNLRIAGGRVVVSLVEGNVALSSANSRAGRLDLVAGQQTVMTGAGIDASTGFDVGAVTAWQRGQMVFYQTPLKEVVAQLNRYRKGRIVVASSDLRDLEVTGVFNARDPDAALSVIQNTLHVRILRLTDYLLLLR